MEPMKIDQINSVFHCNFCKQLFQNPVILPCGEVICRHDLNELKSSNGKFIICFFCKKTHNRPKDDFPSDKRLVRLMELEVDKLNFGETFEYGKTMLKELEETIEEFEAVNINPANFVNNYFSKLKSQVEARRDKFKQKIDHHFDKLLNEIERHKTESEIAAKNFEYNPRKLEVGKDSLGKWIKQYDTMKLDNEKMDIIILKSKLLKLKLTKELAISKQTLLINKSIRFESGEFPDKSAFGTLKIDTLKKADNDDNVLFKFTLNNFSNFKNNPKYVSSSNEFAIGNLKWYLKIDNETDGYIACFLYCLSNNSNNGGTMKKKVIEAEYQIDLLNQNDPAKNYVLSTTAKFNINQGKGWNKFISIEDILSGGFYDEKNDSISFEVFVQIKSIEG